jgi:Ca2+-binding RTX toxin-like protein
MKIMKFSLLLLGLLLFGSLMTVLVAGNTVPVSRAGQMTSAITLAIIVPECASIPTTNIILASGKRDGTTGSDWMFGSSGYDDFDGKDGNDCVVGGDGDDRLQGGGGNDILLGGNGSDELDGQGDTDYCYSGTTNRNCEFIYP